MRRASLLMVLLVASGCPDNNVQPDAAQCSCPAPTAAKVSYAPPDADAGLVSVTNVEQALDQLAARPLAEPKIGTRIKVVSQDFFSPSQTDFTQVLQCPDPLHDDVLAGGCGPIDFSGQTFVTGTSLSVVQVGCYYHQPLATAGTRFTVTATCLLGAR